MRRLLVVMALLGMSPAARATELGAYDYPFVDPLVATVVRTPAANAIALDPARSAPQLVRFRLTGLVERPAPPVFFYQRHGLEFGLMAQRGPAPLVFVIAGTGGGFDADLNRELAEVLFAGGYSVITLPNPTHPNFIVNASATGVPGRLKEDAADLYRVMQKALASVAGRVTVTDIDLTGYSLGGTYAAFVSELDSRERRLGIDRVLLLNPAVSLFDSMTIVDEMLRFHERTDPTAIRRFIERIIAAFGDLNSIDDPVNFAGDFIYRAYAATQLDAVELEKLVGLAFRLSAANMMFTADVVSDSHILVPADRRLTTTTSLTEFYLRARNYGFSDYFADLYVPFFARREPGLTKETMIADARLDAIAGYLGRSANIGLITAEDDFILRPEDFAFVERVFADRASLYPTGGHCGNYRQRDVAARIQAFFRPTGASQ